MDQYQEFLKWWEKNGEYFIQQERSLKEVARVAWEYGRLNLLEEQNQRWRSAIEKDKARQKERAS